MSLFSTSRSVIHRLLDFVCPPSCLTCGADIMAGGELCPSCFAALRPIVRPFCQRCGEPFAYQALESGDGACVTCRDHPPVWHRACAAFVYDDMSRRLIFPLKYADRTTNAAKLARFMGRAGCELLEGNPCLIPVPLHRRKLWQRRYNQAALLARALGRYHDVEVNLDGLIRLRRTRPLARLSVPEREEELRNAFRVRERHKARLRGRRVVLIDDILTTGATAEACARVLLDVGCESVDVLVAARACVGETTSSLERVRYAEN